MGKNAFPEDMGRLPPVLPPGGTLASLLPLLTLPGLLELSTTGPLARPLHFPTCEKLHYLSAKPTPRQNLLEKIMKITVCNTSQSLLKTAVLIHNNSCYNKRAFKNFKSEFIYSSDCIKN